MLPSGLSLSGMVETRPSGPPLFSQCFFGICGRAAPGCSPHPATCYFLRASHSLSTVAGGSGAPGLPVLRAAEETWGWRVTECNWPLGHNSGQEPGWVASRTKDRESFPLSVSCLGQRPGPGPVPGFLPTISSLPRVTQSLNVRVGRALPHGFIHVFVQHTEIEHLPYPEPSAGCWVLGEGRGREVRRTDVDPACLEPAHGHRGPSDIL